VPRRPPRRQSGHTSIPPVYEGLEVLTRLLERAGSPHRGEEVAERFARAQAAGEERSDVIPTLFPDEPRFPSPDDARRLYSNLFGLWMRIEVGLGPVDDAPALYRSAPASADAAEADPPPLPERGAVSGRMLPPEVVEAVWQHLAALPERERRRWRDRFENAQAHLVAWLDGARVPPSGALAAGDLAFEAWAMFDQAFGERLGSASWKALRARASEPPPLESTQPVLATYAAEVLDVLEDEDRTFSAEERAQVERVIATVAAALGDALREELPS